MNLRNASRASSSTSVGVIDDPPHRFDGSFVPSDPPFSALRRCLELQAAAPPRSAFSRLLGIEPLTPPAIDAYRAAAAELSIVDALDALGPEWTVVHSVAVGDGVADIEHLAVGPAGVFSIITRSHAGQRVWVGERTFMAGDERFDYISLAEAQGTAAARLLAIDDGLEPTVTPCIAVGQVASLVVRQRPGRVEVITARHFGGWLGSLPRLLSPSAVESLRASARAVRTTAPEGDADDVLRADFSSLQTAIRIGRVRLFSWVGAGVIASWTIMLLNFS